MALFSGDLQKYVRSGNIAMTDLTQSEGMSDWAPISSGHRHGAGAVGACYGMPMAQDHRGGIGASAA